MFIYLIFLFFFKVLGGLVLQNSVFFYVFGFPIATQNLGGGVGGLANPDYAVPDRPGVDAVGVHINLFVLAYVVYCTMYTAVPPFWSTD